MKGYLDEYGRLWIWRQDKYVMAECRDSTYHPCDERCSRFGEPYQSGINTLLDLCTKTLRFKNFEDKRK